MRKKTDTGTFEKIFGLTLSRGAFLKTLGAALAVMAGSGRHNRTLAAAGKSLQPRKKRTIQTQHDLVVAKGSDPAKATRAAVENLGGMAKFVKRGDTVVVKPNIGWDRSTEQGANTHPAVVAALVKMSFEAGAKNVKVFDATCNDQRRCYENSGIMEAAKRAGATVFYVSDWKFYPAQMAAGSLMNGWPVFKDAVDCDCFINVPVAKHHALTKLTLSMKNLMGVCGEPRGKMHQDISTKLAEMAGFIQPELTVIDASRILLRHGPTGGNLQDVAKKDTVIAGTDYVLADAYATTLFDMRPEDIGYITTAAKMGLGSMKIAGAKIKTITV